MRQRWPCGRAAPSMALSEPGSTGWGGVIGGVPRRCHRRGTPLAPPCGGTPFGWRASSGGFPTWPGLAGAAEQHLPARDLAALRADHRLRSERFEQVVGRHDQWRAALERSGARCELGSWDATPRIRSARPDLLRVEVAGRRRDRVTGAHSIRWWLMWCCKTHSASCIGIARRRSHSRHVTPYGERAVRPCSPTSSRQTKEPVMTSVEPRPSGRGHSACHGRDRVGDGSSWPR
jgi:hypothetical protein